MEVEDTNGLIYFAVVQALAVSFARKETKGHENSLLYFSHL